MLISLPGWKEKNNNLITNKGVSVTGNESLYAFFNKNITNEINLNIFKYCISDIRNELPSTIL